MQTRVTPRLAVLGIALLLSLPLVVAGVTVGAGRPMCDLCHGSMTRADVSHRTVGCAACHSSGSAGAVGLASEVAYRMAPRSLVGTSSGPVVETSREACLACHAEVLESVTATGGLRISHRYCAAAASCDACHALVAHGGGVRWQRGPVMEDCTSCHVRQKIGVGCGMCHSEQEESERVAIGPWQVTHGANWRKTHGLGRLESCVICHPRDYCVRCHKVAVPHEESFGSTHGASAIADRPACLSCHGTGRFCDGCHRMPMPHPAGFLGRHSTVAMTIDDPICARCHPREMCVRCHNTHIHPGFAAVRARQRALREQGVSGE
jgi:hypothetical protein